MIPRTWSQIDYLLLVNMSIDHSGPGGLKLGSLLFQNSVVSFETENNRLEYRSWEPPATGPDSGVRKTCRTDSVSQEVLKHLQYIFILVAPIWLIHIDFIIIPFSI